MVVKRVLLNLSNPLFSLNTWNRKEPTTPHFSIYYKGVVICYLQITVFMQADGETSFQNLETKGH